jgi:hypothetical protein
MQKRIEDFKQYYILSQSVKDVDPNIWMSKYIIDRMELNQEQILWFCFLSSITYQLPTAYMIINEYPDLENVGEDRLRIWWGEVQGLCPFQTDKLKQRKFLPESVVSYKHLVNGSQVEYFKSILTDNANENFNTILRIGLESVAHFGRFSIWNWAQMLKQVAGLPIEPESLLLGDSSSESHTHGICYALGKDEWAKKIRYTDASGKRKKEVHKFSKEDCALLEAECKEMIESLSSNGVVVDNYYIETIACAYKKVFRENDSRYIGYYLDRQAEDIIKTSANWSGVDWDLLWQAREEMLRNDLLNKSVDSDKYKWTYEKKISKIGSERPRNIKLDLSQFLV